MKRPKAHLVEQVEYEGKDLVRLAGLSDGIFGIMLTLLVLELKLPETAASVAGAVGNVELRHMIVERVPEVISYFQAFLVAGVYWVAHHWDVEHIKRFDRRLQWINLMFLLCVSLLPFTTSLVGRYGNLIVGWGVYATNMALIGLMLAIFWGYAVERHFIDPTLTSRLARYITIHHLVLPLVFILSIGLFAVNPTLALFSPVIVLPAQALVRRRVLGEGESAPAALPRVWFWRFATFLPVIVVALGLILMAALG